MIRRRKMIYELRNQETLLSLYILFTGDQIGGEMNKSWVDRYWCLENQRAILCGFGLGGFLAWTNPFF
jgi:hypothetical protein